MVKLTEVEDEHFTEKPIPSKHNVLLASDNEDDDDYTDTGKEAIHSYILLMLLPHLLSLAASDTRDTDNVPESEISTDSDLDLEHESLYERIAALKDIIPPSTRRTVATTVSSLTSFTKTGLSYGGKALWVISTSAFLLGVPWALAYSEEEQYVQMEREQGMTRAANEVRLFFPSFFTRFWIFVCWFWRKMC